MFCVLLLLVQIFWGKQFLWWLIIIDLWFCGRAGYCNESFLCHLWYCDNLNVLHHYWWLIIIDFCILVFFELSWPLSKGDFFMIWKRLPVYSLAQNRRGHNFCFGKSQECHLQDWYIFHRTFRDTEHFTHCNVIPHNLPVTNCSYSVVIMRVQLC